MLFFPVSSISSFKVSSLCQLSSQLLFALKRMFTSQKIKNLGMKWEKKEVKKNLERDLLGSIPHI